MYYFINLSQCPNRAFPDSTCIEDNRFKIPYWCLSALFGHIPFLHKMFSYYAGNLYGLNALIGRFPFLTESNTEADTKVSQFPRRVFPISTSKGRNPMKKTLTVSMPYAGVSHFYELSPPFP